MEWKVGVCDVVAHDPREINNGQVWKVRPFQLNNNLMLQRHRWARPAHPSLWLPKHGSRTALLLVLAHLLPPLGQLLNQVLHALVNGLLQGAERDMVDLNVGDRVVVGARVVVHAGRDGALGAVVLQLNSIDLGQAGLFPRAKVQLNGHDGADVVAVRENWALDSPGEGDGLAVALFANDDNHRGIVFCTDEPLPDEELEGLWNNEVDAILLVQLQVGVQRALVLDARELLLCQLLWFCTVKEVCV